MPYSRSVTSESWVVPNYKGEDIIYRSDIVKQDDEETKGVCTLSFYHSSIFASIIEDTLAELRILMECNNSLRVSKTSYNMDFLLRNKFGVYQPPVTDDLARIDPHKLTCEEYKLNKLDADGELVGEAMQATYIDLALNSSYKSLVDCNNRIVDRESYRVALKEDEAKNKMVKRDLKKQLRLQRNHNKMAIYDTDVMIDNLKDQYENATLSAEIHSRYAMNWERARTEQNLQRIKDTEDVPTGVIENFKSQTDYEQRVHADVVLITDIAINETLAKIESWMNKYDKDLEDLELKIQFKKNDYQNMLAKRGRLEDTIEKHDALMKQWITFKKDREERRKYSEKMLNSAIIVQAWWRGLLVRRQLGPFKVTNKKNKGDKKKK